MNDQFVRITLRIPADLHKEVGAIASQEERSLNWQMVKLMQIGITQLVRKNQSEVNRQNT